MNEALKTLEAMAELLHQELKRLLNTPIKDDRVFDTLRESSLDAINLREKIAEARGWNQVK